MFNGEKVNVLVPGEIQFLQIDPRGHFTLLRCSAIMVFDRLLKKVLGWKFLKRFRQLRKPWVEFAEFCANYPTW